MRTHQLEGRKREEWLGELRNMAHHKQGLTDWKGGRERSGLVSFEAWHIINEDSPTGGEEEGGAGWLALKRSLTQTNTHQLEGRRKMVVSLATWPRPNHPPLTTTHPDT